MCFFWMFYGYYSADAQAQKHLMGGLSVATLNPPILVPRLVRINLLNMFYPQLN